MKKIILVTEMYDSHIKSEQNLNKYENINLDFLINRSYSWASSMYKNLKLLGLDVHVILTNRIIYLEQSNPKNISHFQLIKNKLNEINPDFILFTNQIINRNQILNIKENLKIKFICHCSYIGEK